MKLERRAEDREQTLNKLNALKADVAEMQIPMVRSMKAVGRTSTSEVGRNGTRPAVSTHVIASTNIHIHEDDMSDAQQSVHSSIPTADSSLFTRPPSNPGTHCEYLIVRKILR